MNDRIKATLMLCSLLVFNFGLGILSHTPAQQPEAKRNAAGYYCVMDSDVKSKKPGKCPKCGMDLRPNQNDGDSTPPIGSSPKMKVEEPDSDIKPQIPNVTVYDQDGRKLLFFSDLVKGKTVAINFIFTTCTTICPPLAATFRRIQIELGDRVGNDVRLISISVDPVTDVPARLKAFGAKFKAGPGWTFVTGSKPEIDVLLKSLGAAVSDKNDHTPMMVVGNEPAGYWTRTYGLAPAPVLVKVITDAASKGPAGAGARGLPIRSDVSSTRVRDGTF